MQLPRSCVFQAVSPPEKAYAETVLVHLLDNDKSVSVLRDTLVFHSGHFAELFEHDPDRRAIVVPDISVHLFTVIEGWLRTGDLILSRSRLSYADAVTIYVFGDTYAMPRLQNAIIDFVFATTFEDQLFPLSALNDMYNRTRPLCSLRALLVDIAIAVYNWESLMEKSELLPKDFLLEVIQTIQGKTVRLGVAMFPAEVWHATMMSSLCNWHVHVEPTQYICGNEEPVESEAERIDSADCDLEGLDYGRPDSENVTQSWHSALVMRSR